MASLALAFDILAKDKASKTFTEVGRSAEKAGKQVDGLGPVFNRTGGHISGLGSKIAGLGKAFALGATAIAASGLVIGKSAVSAASDLSESMSKVNVVFGAGAEAVQSWAKTAASSMGMSRQAALEAAGTFGNFLISMGSSREAAQEMSLSMVQLASDLASFNNANPEDVLLALRSGLSGEAEPLRRFGVSLSAARVEAVALASGLAKPLKNAGKITEAGIAVEKANLAAAEALKKHGEGSLEYRDALLKVTKSEEAYSEASKGKVQDLTAAQKAQATYLIIQKDTALAQGDFARTADGLANKQRILAAKFTDLKANIGLGLLPVVLKLADFFEQRLFPIFNRYLPGAADAVGGFVSGALKSLSDWWSRNGEGISTWFSDVGSAIGSAVADGFDALSNWWSLNGDNIATWFSNVGSILADDVGPALASVGGFLKDVVYPGLKSVGEWIVDNEFVFEALKASIIAVAGAWGVYSVAAAVAAAVTGTVMLPLVALTVITAALTAATMWLIDRYRVGLNEAFQRVIDKAAGVLGFFRDLVGFIKDAVKYAKQLIDLLPNITLPGTKKGALPFLGPLDPSAGVPFVPFLDDGGVMPGRRGVHYPAWVAGGETVIPTHKPGVEVGGQSMVVNNQITVSDVRVAKDIAHEFTRIQLQAASY